MRNFPPASDEMKASMMAPKSSAGAPKEIGFIDRASGLVTGLGLLRQRLEGFQERLNGEGSDGCAKGQALAHSGGLDGLLSEAEHELRLCHALLGDINCRF